jgi:hypothetical protein
MLGLHVQFGLFKPEVSAKLSQYQARLQLLIDTWSSTKANGFLSKAAPFPLPSQGPLHKLLMTTKRLVPGLETIGKQTANDVVTTGGALVIAKMAKWLQQQPGHFLMSRSSLNMEIWLLLHQFILFTLVICLHLMRHHTSFCASLLLQVRCVRRCLPDSASVGHLRLCTSVCSTCNVNKLCKEGCWRSAKPKSP